MNINSNMKNLIKNAIYIASMIIILSSCGVGKTHVELNGNEEQLPPELKGVKIYSIKTGVLSSVEIALLNNNINSITYPYGKSRKSTIIVNKQNGKLIEVTEILIENDSLIVCRK